MSNDSTAPGYLGPVSAPPPDDDALNDIVQAAIVGITALEPTLVRPRGQPDPPPMPAASITWCAFAVTVDTPDANPSIVHDGSADGGLGQDIAIRGEDCTVNISFYGPSAIGTATLLTDGLGIAQNRATLAQNGLAYVGIDRVTYVPDLVNTSFLRRADLVLSFRRMSVRAYAVRNIVSGSGTILTRGGTASGLTTIAAPFTTGS